MSKHYNIIVRGDVPRENCLFIEIVKTESIYLIESVAIVETVTEERFYSREKAYHELAERQNEVLLQSIFFKTKKIA